jgi:hypothetical protein
MMQFGHDTTAADIWCNRPWWQTPRGTIKIPGMLFAVLAKRCRQGQPMKGFERYNISFEMLNTKSK